jgi:hypothetical protein
MVGTRAVALDSAALRFDQALIAAGELMISIGVLERDYVTESKFNAWLSRPVTISCLFLAG